MNPLWRQLEDHLATSGFQQITARGLAVDLSITRGEATRMIQSHLWAQRHGRATLYVIHRTGRTKNAVWHVGARSADMREMTRQCFDDIQTHIHEVLFRDMERMSNLNPRIGRLVTATMNALDANLAMMEAGLP